VGSGQKAVGSKHKAASRRQKAKARCTELQLDLLKNQPPNTRRSLPTAYCLLLTAHSPLPTAQLLSPSPCRWRHFLQYVEGTVLSTRCLIGFKVCR